MVILLFLAVPSFQLLTAQYTPPEEPKLTVKATGNQWNWDYEYQVDESRSPSTRSCCRKATAPPPARKTWPTIRACSPSTTRSSCRSTRPSACRSPRADVIHAFAVPSFGVKVDAVPGRLNETWFKADQEGIYYGQCSELCGKDHAFMPIAIRVVSQEQLRRLAGRRRRPISPTPTSALTAAIDGATARSTSPAN